MKTIRKAVLGRWWPVLLAALGAFFATQLTFGQTTVRSPQDVVNSRPSLLLQVFVRGDSKRCQDAVAFAEQLVRQREGICLQVVDVMESDAALEHYKRTAKQFRVEEPRVPAFVACGRLTIGFNRETKTTDRIEDLFTIHAFVRPSCQHCEDAMRFLNQLATRWPGVRIAYHDIDREVGGMDRLVALAKPYGVTVPALSSIFVCGRLISGYRTDASTGRQIEELLWNASAEQTPRHAEANEQSLPAGRGLAELRSTTWPTVSAVGAICYGVLAPAAGPDSEPSDSMPVTGDGEEDRRAIPMDALPDVYDDATTADESYTAPIETPEGIDLPWFGFVRVGDLGLPAFTLLIGLVDGFNPCAMWVLVFLLSVLVNVKDRRKIAAIAGTFVVVSGAAYFAFMAAWLNLFMFVGIARPLQIALGGLAIVIGIVNVKDFFAFKKGMTLSIPESAKPGIYAQVRRIVSSDYISVAIGLAVVLAVGVKVVELLCTAGLPALYTQVLMLQELPSWKNYLYLGLYILGYMFDDGLMVIAFVATLSHRKMREVEGRWLKLISGLVILVLGLALLFRPDWLQW